MNQRNYKNENCQLELELIDRTKEVEPKEPKVYDLQRVESITPFERVKNFGPESLTTAELLAVTLGGTQEDHFVATNIVSQFRNDNDLKKASIHELINLCEDNELLAHRVKAVLELGYRLVESKPDRAVSAFTIADTYMVRMKDYEVEVVKCLFLDCKMNIIVEEDLFRGGINQSILDCNVVFKKALEYGAKRLVTIHNHPSGNPQRSNDDIRVTKRLKAVGYICGVELVDHIIVGFDEYYSFRENDFEGCDV